MDIKARDFAAQHGVTNETIYKKIRRKPAELEGHTYRKNNATWLDETAQEYLAASLVRQPLVVTDNSMAAELEQLRKEKEILQNALITTQQQLISTQQQLTEAAEAKYMLNAAKNDLERLQERIKELENDTKTNSFLRFFRGR